MARKLDIGFGCSIVKAEPASVHSHVAQNLGSFTRRPQLVGTQAWAGFWNLFGLAPDHFLQLTLLGDSGVPVSNTDVLDDLVVAATCSKFRATTLALLDGAKRLTGSLVAWLVDRAGDVCHCAVEGNQERADDSLAMVV